MCSHCSVGVSQSRAQGIVVAAAVLPDQELGSTLSGIGPLAAGCCGSDAVGSGRLCAWLPCGRVHAADRQDHHKTRLTALQICLVDHQLPAKFAVALVLCRRFARVPPDQHWQGPTGQCMYV